MNGGVETAGERDSTDILLWLGCLVVAGVGLTWLALAKPWQSLSGDERVIEPPVTVVTTQPEIQPEAPQPMLESTLDNPLRMARLALEAGMLLEPAGFSAWSLYEQVLEDEPDQSEALDGLTLVADTLVGRGAVALEQGRLDDVRDIVARILGIIPDHGGAMALALELGEPVLQTDARDAIASKPPSPEPILPVPIIESPQVIEAPVIETPEPEPPPVDPLVELRSSFDGALADNRLLTPVDKNARYFLDGMIGHDAQAEVVVEARELLVEVFLERASAATETLDADAAQAWIIAAESLRGNAAAITQARTALTTRLIQAESLKPYPASQLQIVEYVAPRYPMRASNRSIEGWVDLEFFVTAQGLTREITITDASHDTYFREQAVSAIEQWEFEPRIFLGQSIEQRAYTRIRFNLQ